MSNVIGYVFCFEIGRQNKERIKILLTDNGNEFKFDEGFVPELKRMKTSVYHPQGNSFFGKETF
jgi:hypothetical protein